MIRAAVLSGGGVKGAFQVGAIQNLIVNKNLYISKWFGTSTGALQSVVMAQGDSLVSQITYARKLLEIYRLIKSNKDIYDGPSNSFTKGFALFDMQFRNRKSLYEPKGLQQLLKENVIPTRLADRFACGVVDFERRTHHLIESSAHPYDILDYVMASASMPVYFPPVKINGNLYVDGGLREQTMFSDAVTWLRNQDNTHQKELVVILTQPLVDNTTKSSTSKLLDKFSTVLDTIINEVYLNDLAKLIERNELAAKGSRQYQFISVKLIHPNTHYPYTLEFNPQNIDAMIRDGMYTPIQEIDYPIDLNVLALDREEE